MNRFLLLSTQRSGSSFLGTSLGSHPDITCFEEVFMPRNQGPRSFSTYRTASLRRRIEYLIARRRTIFRFLDELYASVGPGQSVGFKFMYRQAQRHPEVIAWCERNDVRVVHLIRRNFLKILLSRLQAKRRGIYHAKQAIGSEPLKIDTRTLKSRLGAMASLIERNSRRFENLNCLVISYEELVAEQSEVFRRILAFLDADPEVNLSSDLVKINREPLANLILNYDEVASVLHGSPYESLLES